MLKKGQKVSPPFEEIVAETCRLFHARNRECCVDWLSPVECSVFTHRQREEELEFKVSFSFSDHRAVFSIQYLFSDVQLIDHILLLTKQGYLDELRSMIHKAINELRWVD